MQQQQFYPSLPWAMAVDSSFASRQKLITDMRRLNLFENLIEAPSVTEALATVNRQRLDACLIGPFISHDSAKRFVRRLKNSENARNCALIAVLRDGDERGAGLREIGVHTVLTETYNFEAFSAALIEAVQAASDAQTQPAEAPEKEPQVMLTDILFSGAANLRVLAEVLWRREKEGKRDLDSPKVTEAICLIVDQMMLRTTSGNPLSIDDRVLSAGIAEWFQNSLLYPEQAAMHLLSRLLHGKH